MVVAQSNCSRIEVKSQFSASEVTTVWRYRNSIIIIIIINCNNRISRTQTNDFRRPMTPSAHKKNRSSEFRNRPIFVVRFFSYDRRIFLTTIGKYFCRPMESCVVIGWHHCLLNGFGFSGRRRWYIVVCTRNRRLFGFCWQKSLKQREENERRRNCRLSSYAARAVKSWAIKVDPVNGNARQFFSGDLCRPIASVFGFTGCANNK